MARLTMKQRKALPKSEFLVPSKAPGPGSFPVPDRSHLKNAEARAVQTGRPAVAAKAKRRLGEQHDPIGEMDSGYRPKGSGLGGHHSQHGQLRVLGGKMC